MAWQEGRQCREVAPSSPGGLETHACWPQASQARDTEMAGKEKGQHGMAEDRAGPPPPGHCGPPWRQHSSGLEGHPQSGACHCLQGTPSLEGPSPQAPWPGGESTWSSLNHQELAFPSEPEGGIGPADESTCFHDSRHDRNVWLSLPPVQTRPLGTCTQHYSSDRGCVPGHRPRCCTH